jgi:hypothetical protein
MALAVASLCALGAGAWALLDKSRANRDYAPFAECPLGDRATDICLYTRAYGGAFDVGAKRVPVRRAITLQGGVNVVENGEKEVVRDRFIGARNGETLSPTPEDVPGGLGGVVDAALLPAVQRQAFDGFIARGPNMVTATVELAAPASRIGVDMQNLVEATGTAVSLPVKVKLTNAFLGDHCYIGSDAHPIVLRLGTGRTKPLRPNKPIAGRVGRSRLKDRNAVVVVEGSLLVDNAFAIPGAAGCGRSPAQPIDRAVDAALGLPARAGENAVMLRGTLHQAYASSVRAHGQRAGADN